MAAPESVAVPSFPFFPLFLSSLSFLILLFLWAKRRSSSRARCGEKNHLGLRCDLPAWDSPPPPQRLDEGRDEEASPGSEEKGRRKRSRKKRVESRGGSDGADEERNAASVDTYRIGDLEFGKIEFIYPFSSFASSTQRKIKMQYDEIVKSNKEKTLTMAQVGQFINCLVVARTELQRKAEIIQRSFKIKKALLCKADRSSFDRLCQQICKLEMDHKRLEEDAIVYNLLQEQLKLSSAYKMLLEASENTEDKIDSDHATEPPDITFEELLAQEKKDMFWQKNRKLRKMWKIEN
ncbi:uncharacterized protein LOC121995754 [Zingiber officinale]|uniref:uncharacterized protein LOC121995754 n=1 Tax=Zingiber officinale TaxID=94328 RepID=UPI001C4CEC81|nr:uncharacterized protein LOC121995754 [Zingiber officinale]